MKKSLLLLFTLFFTTHFVSFGQHDNHGIDTSKVTLNKSLTDYAWSLKAGYIYQAGNLVEIGILKQKYHYDLYYHLGALHGTSGPSISCEYNFDKKLIGPKIGYETTLLFFTGKGSMIYYTDFKESTLCLLPELGISFFGFIVLSGRYNIPLFNRKLLFKDSFDAMGVAVTFNIPLKLKRLTVAELRDKSKLN